MPRYEECTIRFANAARLMVIGTVKYNMRVRATPKAAEDLSTSEERARRERLRPVSTRSSREMALWRSPSGLPMSWETSDPKTL